MRPYLFSPICLHGVDRENFTLLAASSIMDRSILVRTLMTRVHNYEISTGRKKECRMSIKETSDVVLRLEWATRPKSLKLR